MLSLSEWAAGSVNIVSNDTDPDGDYPLISIAVSEPGGRAYLVNSTTIGWTGSSQGYFPVTYTVRNSRGATSTGVLYVQVTMMCGEFAC